MQIACHLLCALCAVLWCAVLCVSCAVCVFVSISDVLFLFCCLLFIAWETVIRAQRQFGFEYHFIESTGCGGRSAPLQMGTQIHQKIIPHVR